MQEFATNNRQLFADVSRIGWLERLLGLGTLRSPYKPPRYNTESVLSFQSAYGRSAELSRASSTSVDDDWQCNPAVAREVLEITLR